MTSILRTNLKELNEKCEQGIDGRFKLPVTEVSIQLTNVCNNYCIMCHTCSEQYTNHTYYNQLPFNVNLHEYKKIIPSPQKSFVELIFKRNQNREKLELVFRTAETLLNPHFYDIVKYTKDIY